jgi:hypothetical protein
VLALSADASRRYQWLEVQFVDGRQGGSALSSRNNDTAICGSTMSGRSDVTVKPRAAKLAEEERAMRRSDPKAYDRRNFLRTLVGASTTALAVVATPTSAAQAYDPGERETASRYRETEHVKAFYRTNGYEGMRR